MDSDKKAQIHAYIQNRLDKGEATLRAMSQDTTGALLPTRSAYLVIDKYIRDFKLGTSETRWVVIPGLRGVGKTTLVAQVYTRLACKAKHKIYISLDEANRSLDVTIGNILDVFEKDFVEDSFEEMTEPVYIFLDEVQYDKTWGVTLKNIYDRSKKVFIICTGSSALSLQTNPDVARRVAPIPIYPLSFAEYQMIKHRKYPTKMLGNSIKVALLGSANAEEVYTKLKTLESQVDDYWNGKTRDGKKVQSTDIDTYLKYGSLPSALAASSEPLVYTQINQTLNNVLNRDVPQLDKFDKPTLDKLSQILYLVSGTDVVSFNTIASTVDLNVKTIVSVFNALEKTEMLIRIYPYGSHESQVRKPSKFLFKSPAYRAMYYNVVGSIFTFDHYKGKLLEDVTGLYLTRALASASGSSITYDTAKGGADFIIDAGLPGLDKIIMEVGMGKKDFNQISNTMKKVKARYGLAVSDTNLTLSNEKGAVLVPLKYFLLM